VAAAGLEAAGIAEKGSAVERASGGGARGGGGRGAVGVEKAAQWSSRRRGPRWLSAWRGRGKLEEQNG